MTLYDDLGVSPGASQEEIKKAYQRLARKHHPDKGGDHDDFVGVQKAYEVLTNEEKRHSYDTKGSVEEPMGLEEKARQNFMALFNQVISSKVDPKHDLLKLMTQSVRDNISRVTLQIHGLQQERKKLQQINKRLISQSGQDFLRSLLDDKRKQLWLSYKDLREIKKVMQLIIPMIEEYKYKADAPVQTSYWTSSTTSTMI